MANLLVRVGLNSAGFKTGLAKLKATAVSFKSSVGGMMSGLGSQMLGALGLSMGIAGLGMLARKAIDAGSKISDTATHLRIGTTELQALQSAARDAGVDMSKFEMALNNINLRTIEAADGNQTYRDAFERLGMDLKNFNTLSTEQKLEALARAYHKSGESLEALNDISTLLGQKAGSQLLEVLNRLATEGMDNLTQSAKAAGDVMDEETVTSLDNAADEIGRWQNRIIVWFGTFLADMGSAIGRQKWGYYIGMKFAEAGEYIETALRNISNYLFATFSTIFRYLTAQFSSFIVPIRNIYFEFFTAIGNAVSSFVSLFSDSWSKAIDEALSGMNKMKDAANKASQRDKGKSFTSIFGDELYRAEEKNANRKRSDMLSSGSVDWWKDRLKDAEKIRDIEKQSFVEADKARKAKYAAADKGIEIKESGKDKADRKKEANREKGYNDSTLAKIGGGGLLAARYDVSAKQLSEAKKQSKLLEKISDNTENSKNKSELLMK